MGLLDVFKTKRAIAVLLTPEGAASPQGVQAIASLKQLGKRAIPKLIEAFAQTQSAEPLIALLATFVQNDTLPLFTQRLAHTNPLVVSGLTQVLSRSKTYDANRLLELFNEARFSKNVLGKILGAHKDTLNAKALLSLLEAAGKDARPTLCRLVDEVAHAAMIPELIRALGSDDWTVRLTLVRALARFDTLETRQALLRCLSDAHKNVRHAALEGLANLGGPLDIQPICAMLRDADLEVQTKAIETLSKLNDPRTVHHLIEILQDETEYVRRGAVEVLNAVGNASAIKDLLGALKDQDWWVRVRAADALGTIGGPRVVDAVLTLIKDEDEFIRRSAVEIINTTKDPKAFEYLLEALADDDWWVKERAIDALAALGDQRAVPALLQVLERGEPQASSVTIKALATLGDERAIAPLIAELQNESKVIRQEALRALSTMTDEAHVQAVVQAVQIMPRSAEEENQLIHSAITTITERFGQKLAFTTPGVTPAKTPALQVKSLMPGRGEGRTPADTTSHSPGATPPPVLVSSSTAMPIIDASTLVEGDVVGDRYRIIRKVGRGGFGTVLLAEDVAVREKLILKFLNPHLAADERMVSRFVHELRYARRVAHENVIRIYDFLMLGRSYAISMEYFPSHSLGEEMRPRKPLNFKRGLKIIWDVCNGMKAAHQAKVVHRDLKPPNILIDDAGAVKIVDFGLAAASSNVETRLTRTGALVGTPMYMAPEQVESRSIDARTDIYSLGIIMYEIFTGRPPYIGDNSMAVLFQHVAGKAVPPHERNPRIPPALEAIILKAMAVDPEERFQTMDELRKSIVALTR